MAAFKTMILSYCALNPLLRSGFVENSHFTAGFFQAVQMVLSCLPGASLVPHRLSN